jgi:hypothetical protein
VLQAVLSRDPDEHIHPAAGPTTGRSSGLGDLGYGWTTSLGGAPISDPAPATLAMVRSTDPAMPCSAECVLGACMTSQQRRSDSAWWQLTDDLVDEAGMCGLPLYKRVWWARSGRDRSRTLRQPRLELIAINASIAATRAHIARRDVDEELGRLVEIEALVEKMRYDAWSESGVDLPWAELDALRNDVGLEPSMRLNDR